MPRDDGPDISHDTGQNTGNPWTRLRAKVQYENPWIKVVEHDVLTPAGAPGIYGVVHIKHLAIGVLPIDDEGHTYLVGQYRFPFDAYSWEMPEGGGKPDVAPLESARRELVEETGLTARCWQEVLRMDLSNSITDETAICFIAWGLEQGAPCPEDTEVLQIRRVPFAEALDMVWKGAITDSMTVATLLKVRMMAERGELPQDVARLFLGSRGP